MIFWVVGAVLALGGAGVIQSVVVGFAESTLLVALIPITVGLTLCLVFGRILGSLKRDGERVRELPTRGIRRRGLVRDALPYGSTTGGAVFQPEGAEMVLRVELDPRDGVAGSSVSIHVVEDSSRARARIGTEVTIIEHPDDPLLRALEGFMPNGRPMR